jgi:hypothetical protein
MFPIRYDPKTAEINRKRKKMASPLLMAGNENIKVSISF